MFERGLPGLHRSHESQVAASPSPLRTEADLTPEEFAQATEGLGGFNNIINIIPHGFRIDGVRFVPVDPSLGKGLDGWLRIHFPDLGDYTR